MREVAHPVEYVASERTAPLSRLRLSRPAQALGRTASTLETLFITTDNVVTLGDHTSFLSLNEVNALNVIILAERAPMEAGQLIDLSNWHEDFGGDHARARQEFGRAKDILNEFSQRAAALMMIEQSAHGRGSKPTYWLNDQLAIVDNRNWLIAFDEA